MPNIDGQMNNKKNNLDLDLEKVGKWAKIAFSIAECHELFFL